MNLKEVLEVCKCYNDLGWAIQEQLDTIVAGNMNDDDLNPNALDPIKQWLCEVEELALGKEPNKTLYSDAEDALQRCEDYTGET